MNDEKEISLQEFVNKFNSVIKKFEDTYEKGISEENYDTPLTYEEWHFQLFLYLTDNNELYPKDN